MSFGWPIKNMEDIYDVRDGTHDSQKYQEEGYPLITSKNLKNGLLNFEKVKYISKQDYENINSRSKVDIGDVLFAMIGTIGNPVVIIEEPNYAIKNVALFKVNSNHSSEYLKYYLDSSFVIGKMIKEAKGTTQKFVGLGYLRKFPIPVPSLEKQNQIVAILDQAFAAIDQAQANIQKNIQNAQDLFQSKLNQIFSQQGEGWEVKKLGEISDFKNGLNFKKSSNGEIVKLVGVGDFKSHFLVQVKELQSIQVDGLINELYELKNGDILTVRSNGNPKLIGRCILAEGIKEKTSHSGFTIRIRPDNETIFPSYLCHILKSSVAREKLTSSGTGINIKSLNQGALSSLEINYPTNLSTQKVISIELDNLSVQAQKLESLYMKKLNSIEELKKSLLQKAFNGELTQNKQAA